YAGGGVEVPWVELANLTFSMEGMAVESLVSANLEERDRESGVERRRVTLQEDTNDDYETLVEARNSLSVLTPITVRLHCINAILMVQIFRHSGTLLDGVVNTTHFHCTDPRDHVYSLLSLGAVGPTVLPDYTAS